MFALDAADIFSLVGQRVRVSKGHLVFEGMLVGPSERRFPRGDNGTGYGCIVDGEDFRLEFAWWDWDVSPIIPERERIAA